MRHELMRDHATLIEPIMAVLQGDQFWYQFDTKSGRIKMQCAGDIEIIMDQCFISKCNECGATSWGLPSLLCGHEKFTCMTIIAFIMEHCHYIAGQSCSRLENHGYDGLIRGTVPLRHVMDPFDIIALLNMHAVGRRYDAKIILKDKPAIFVHQAILAAWGVDVIYLNRQKLTNDVLEIMHYYMYHGFISSMGSMDYSTLCAAARLVGLKRLIQWCVNEMLDRKDYEGLIASGEW